MKDNIITINNRVYNITYSIDCNGDIYVENFSINPSHQGKHRHYSKRIFNSLLKKYNPSVLYLECFPDLADFYKKCGFIQWSHAGNSWGGVEMHLYNKNYVEPTFAVDKDDSRMFNDSECVNN